MGLKVERGKDGNYEIKEGENKRAKKISEIKFY